MSTQRKPEEEMARRMRGGCRAPTAGTISPVAPASPGPGLPGGRGSAGRPASVPLAEPRGESLARPGGRLLAGLCEPLRAEAPYELHTLPRRPGLGAPSAGFGLILTSALLPFLGRRREAGMASSVQRAGAPGARTLGGRRHR